MGIPPIQAFMDSEKESSILTSSSEIPAANYLYENFWEMHFHTN